MRSRFGPLWPPLLFRQLCILAGIFGILCVRHPVPAFVALALLVVFELPRMRSPQALCSLGVAFLLGAFIAFVAEPPKSVEAPAWAQAAVTPSDDKQSPFYTGIALIGRIHEVTRLPDNRLRLILEDVRRVSGREAGADRQAAGNDAGQTLPGRMVLTWQHPSPQFGAIGPGLILHGVFRLRTERSFKNFGVWSPEEYWQDQGVFYRAWTQGDGGRAGKYGAMELSGACSRSWSVREALRARVVTVLQENPYTSVALADGGKSLSQSAAVLVALLFGDRSYISQYSQDIVARATLAHSLALSGLHLGFAAALGFALAMIMGWVFPFIYLACPRNTLGIACALPCGIAYLWLGGAPPSLVRATLMLLFWAYLLWRKRSRIVLDGLFWAVALILLVSPLTLYDLRFQLSALSVAAIALVVPVLERLRTVFLSRGKSIVLESLATPSPIKMAVVAAISLLGISLAAQTAIMPLTLNAFGTTGLWFPLNLVWLPVLGAIVMPAAFAGLAATGIGWDWGAAAAFTVASLPCAGLLGGLSWLDAIGWLIAPLSQRPHWIAGGGFAVLMLCLPGVFMRRAFSHRSALLVCIGMFMLLTPSVARWMTTSEDMVRLRLLDVGQGQAVSIEWGTGRILIDGGGFASPTFDVGKAIVASALTDNYPPELAWIINTHADTDHLQGLLYPMAHFRTGAFARPPESGPLTRLQEKRDAVLGSAQILEVVLQAGGKLVLAPELILEVLHPQASRPEGKLLSPNNTALMMRLVWKGRALALLSSDLEKSGLRHLRSSGVPLQAEVLVLPHHGAASSLDEVLYDTVQPKLALASCGYGNQWGFPSKVVREALAERAIPLETTAERGQIVVTWRSGVPAQMDFARN